MPFSLKKKKRKVSDPLFSDVKLRKTCLEVKGLKKDN